MNDNELKKSIEREVTQMFKEWDASYINSIYERIVDDVIIDIKETSDYPNHNDSDIRIAITRVVLYKLL